MVLKPKAGEADEDEMVRQLVISNMISGDDATSAKVRNYAAHAEDISKLPAAIRLQILINQIKHHESKELTDLYLNTMLMSIFSWQLQGQLSTALAYTTDALH